MEVDWGRLRTFRTSKEQAFEELCCQIAEEEKPANCVSFVRKGTPDAGIECYWTLLDGSEIGWQAKFHRDALDDGRWNGIEESFRTALVKHPKLAKYVVCLPRNLSDSRNNKTEQDRYEERVKKWKEFAEKEGREVEIELWNETQLVRRLSRSTNRGMVWFWFDTPTLTNDWFRQHIREATSNANAQDRYDRKLHIENTEVVYFNALCRTPRFWSELKAQFEHVGSESTYFKRAASEFRGQPEFKDFEACVEVLFQCMRDLLNATDDLPSTQAVSAIPLDELKEAIGNCHVTFETLRDRVDQELQDREPEKEKAAHTHAVSEELRKFRNRSLSFSRAIQAFSSVLNSKQVRCANSTGLLLDGESGQGKTHTLCDWSQKAIESDSPAILLFGENFDSRSPWAQIIEQVGLNCDEDEFVGALIAAARCNRRVALISIDALNEGVGKRIWRSNLAGMLKRLQGSEWIRVCISVRTTYKKFVLPGQGLDALTEIRHRGFSGHGREAIAKYFAAYGIQPSRPPLTPEFDNPLFLKLFCEGMKCNQLQTVPRGINGISSISNFFLEGVNKQLSERLGLDVRAKLVQAAVSKLAGAMAAQSADRLDYEVAKQIVAEIHSSEQFENTLFRNLEHEAIITTVPRAKEGDDLTEDTRFTFQRFSDHFVTKELLESQIEDIKRTKNIAEDSPLGKLLNKMPWSGRGIVEALAIQVPELTGLELFEISLGESNAFFTPQAIVQSLAWRDSSSITPLLLDYLESNVVVSEYEELRDKFWETVLTLATIPGHPLNADWLHSRLVKQLMPQRDSWWSTFLHYQNEQQSAANDLIQWGWFDSGGYEYDDEVCELAGVALCWMFATPNRKIRDSATKAAVALCLNRPNVLASIFHRLKNVDDTYIAERLYAVVCGCSLLTNDDDVLGRLASMVYSQVFADGNPPHDMLLRDYARQTIELAIHRGVVEVDLNNVRPPYASEWPEIPTEEDARAIAQSSIAELISGYYGEFAKSVADLDGFSAVPLANRPPTPDEELEAFVESLTDRQWEFFEQALSSQYSEDKTEYQENLNILEKSLRKGSKKRELFDERIRDLLEDPSKRLRSRPRHEKEPAKRWMQVRAMELGWDSKLFFEFDNSLGHDHDAIVTGESIGKKYCWIALRELQGRAADNFEMEWATNEDSFLFEGPWQIIYGRNIDPTNLLKETSDRREVPEGEVWWVPANVTSWNEQLTDSEWARLDSDIPSPMRLLSVADKDGRHWLVARCSYEWESPTPPGERGYDSIRRSISCSIKSYLVKNHDIESLRDWIANDRRNVGKIPSNRDWSDIFFGEYYWSTIYRWIESEHSFGMSWSAVDEFSHPLPCEMLATNFEYTWSSSSDFSLDDHYVHLLLPSKVIHEEMGLCADIQGRWRNGNGEVAAIDPAAFETGPNALLFDRHLLQEYLARQNLCIFWTVVPERRLVGLDHEGYEGQIHANGLYWFVDGELTGDLSTKFVAAHEERE